MPARLSILAPTVLLLLGTLVGCGTPEETGGQVTVAGAGLGTDTDTEASSSTGRVGDSDRDTTGGRSDGDTAAVTGSGSMSVGESTGAETGANSTDAGPETTGTDTDAYARDISLTRVTINQGIESWLYDEGTTPGPSYPLVSGRPAVISAGWHVHDGFAPRMIRFVLTVLGPDGSVVFEQERAGMVSASSLPQPLGVTDAWILPANAVVQGARASLALLEMPGVDGPTQPPEGTRLPGDPDTFAALPVTDAVSRLRVTLVPLTHRRSSCEASAPTGDAVRSAVADSLWAMYPVQDAEVTLHDPVVFTGSVTDDDLVNAVAFLAELRAAESPADDVIYYGLLDPCDSDSCSGLVGQAYTSSSPDGADGAPWRVGIGRICSSTAQTPEDALDTLRHEIGHVLGRMHVACNGDEDMPDPDYPHPGGLIGGWGVDADAGVLRGPTTPEVMSYCPGPRWTSGYGWEQVHDVITALSDLGTSAAPTDRQEHNLMVRVAQNGEVNTRWVAMPVRGGAPIEGTYVGNDGTSQRVHGVEVKLAETDEQVLLLAAPKGALGPATRLQVRDRRQAVRSIAVPTLSLGCVACDREAGP